MQNRYRQLREYWSVILIIIFIPILLFVTLQILPTHDDWTSSTSPDFTPFFTKEHFLFYGYHWRPFDTWIGYIVGRNPQLLFPAFNHCLVVFGHIICAFLLFRLLINLDFKKNTANIVTVFFFLNPAVLASVLAVDSQNQVFSLAFGIISFMAYTNIKKGKYIIWPLLIFITTLTKENGLMWSLICPLLAFGFDIIALKTFKKDLIIGFAIILAYFTLIFILPKDITIHQEYVPESIKIVKNVIKFLFSSFITIDYVYLLHSPKRNLLFAAISFILALPFLFFVFGNIKLYKQKKTICIAICLLIAVSPHLLTVFSMMHTYAGLVFVALLVALGIEKYNNLKHISVTFILYIICALLIDIHLTQESILSGLTGKRMAEEAIRKTDNPVNTVFLIIIEENFTKLSSFCTVPYEAFGWGLAAKYETNYKWPIIISDTIISRDKNAYLKAVELGKKALQNETYKCVWIVNHENIDVIRNSEN